MKEVLLKNCSYKEEILVDSTLQIDVSKTKLEASILITEPIGRKIFSTADIMQNLNQEVLYLELIKTK